MKLIHAQSGHTMHVQAVPAAMVPDCCDSKSNYDTFYVVRNWDKDGVVFFYLGKGHAQAPKQIVAWYRNGALWSGYGSNLKDAIDGAQKDGWLYARADA